MTAANALDTTVPEGLPLVSAVIPTRNRPDFVCRAVRSALAQTYPNLEVIVVIDGPDEATVMAVERLDDVRVRIVALQENVGGSEARNIGVRQAKGKYVALLDDDDEWLPEKIEKQVALAAGASSVLVVCQYLTRSADGHVTCFPKRFPKADQPISEYMFASFSGFQTSTFFCAKARFSKVPFSKGLAGCQDLDWFLRVMTEPDAEIKCVPEPLAIFNIPENRPSVSRQLKWRFGLEWGRRLRDRMTARGYSSFILRVCLEKMVESNFALQDMLEICEEYFLRGTPSFTGTLRVAAILVLPRSAKELLRELRTMAAPR